MTSGGHREPRRARNVARSPEQPAERPDEWNRERAGFPHHDRDYVRGRRALARSAHLDVPPSEVRAVAYPRAHGNEGCLQEAISLEHRTERRALHDRDRGTDLRP